jgi:squalene-hopene/tetraprenyl-beta-curcumene cyclase
MRLLTGILLTAMAAGATAQQINTRATPDGQLDWDRKAAAQYLDERIDLWFVNATKLKTGQSQTSCISCHTVVPYLLARPVLRKAMQVADPTPQEAKLLGEITQRVDTYPDHQALSDAKHDPSGGTEPVLNALILAREDSYAKRKQLSVPARKAFQQLWEKQRPDGAWDWMDFAEEPQESGDGQYYGAALAALAVGTAPGLIGDSESETAIYVDRLRAYLNGKYGVQNLHNRAWVLLASTRLAGLLSREQRDGLIRELQAKQNSDGGWSLYGLGPWRWSKTTPPFAPPGKTDVSLLEQSDGYATGLVAYVLRETGMPSADPTLKKATEWLIANQKEVQIGSQVWKTWRTHSLNHDRENGGAHGEPWRRMMMSDVATAFAVLALLPSE